MTYRECYEQGCRTLQAAGIEEAALDARLLLEAVCGTDRNDLLVHGEQPVAPEAEEKYLNWIRQRAEHIPLQQLTGEQGFMGLTFSVNEHVLIPRQDTEILVEEVLKELHDGMRVLDMCTGSGCILLSLLHYSNDCEGLGVDLSAEALEVAGRNVLKVLTPEKAEHAHFLQSDLFEKVEGKFEIIVSNPPYIASAEVEKLMPEVREHEPILALDGMEDGLYFYRKIVAQAGEHLEQGGWLCFEIGYDQGEALKEMMTEAGYGQVKIIKDLAGLDRVAIGQKNNNWNAF